MSQNLIKHALRFIYSKTLNYEYSIFIAFRISFFLILFIYFVFFSVSLRLEKNENEAEIAVKRKSVPFRWKDLVDPKIKKWALSILEIIFLL